MKLERIKHPEGSGQRKKMASAMGRKKLTVTKQMRMDLPPFKFS